VIANRRLGWVADPLGGFSPHRYLDPDGGKEILADFDQIDDFLFPSDPSQADPMQWLPQTGGGWDFGTNGGGWDDWSDMCDGILLSCA
jgi:hypothetical protein